MEHEYGSLVFDGTWELVDRPDGRAFVSNMWVYKIEFDFDGDISRCKARFVARGAVSGPASITRRRSLHSFEWLACGYL
jgi:hypothetical protein